jgi:hypothetical protein
VEQVLLSLAASPLHRPRIAERQYSGHEFQNTLSGRPLLIAKAGTAEIQNR